MSSWWDTINKGYDAYNNNTALSQLVVPGLFSLYDRNQQSKAVDKSTGQMVGGLDQGLAQLGQTWQQARAGSAPYQAFGLEGMGQYSQLLSDPNAVTQSQDYQHRFGQGQQALERSQAAKGMSLSGNTLQELQQYGQGMATQELDAALQRRTPMIEAGLTSERSLAQLGQGYADAIASLYGQRGGAQAIGTQSQADVTSGTLTDIGDLLKQGKSLYDQAGGLKDLASGGSAGGMAGGTGWMTGGASSVGASGMGMAGTGAAGLGALGSMSTTPLSAGMSGFGASAMAPGGQGMAAMFPGIGAEGLGTAGSQLMTEATKGATSAAGAAASAKAAMSKITSFMQTAPGMGVVAGIMTGLTTGDWKKAATVGLGTAGGAKLGSMVMPGIGTVIGGVLGGLFGGKIGPKPSNKAATLSLDLNTGTIKDQSQTGKKAPSAEQTKAVKGITSSLQGMSSTIKDVFPNAKFGHSIGVEIGQRDGLGVYVNGKRTLYKHTDHAKWEKGIADAFASSIGGVSDAQKAAIAKVDFSSPQLAKAQLEYIKNTIQ